VILSITLSPPTTELRSSADFFHRSEPLWCCLSGESFLAMAKYRHRTFEMFEFYDEAVATLSLRPRNTPELDTISDIAFEQITVSQSEKIIRVAFKQSSIDDPSSTCLLREDLVQLAAMLPNDSRVIFDFDGVEHFSGASLETLEFFYRRLKVKGSRLLLCNLTAEAKSTFYPPRVPR
jgi:hypothetical protein